MSHELRHPRTADADGGKSARNRGSIGLLQHGATIMTASARLTQLSRDLARLRPDWRNPERYFENRHEIERAMRRLARQLEEHRG